MFIFSEYKFGLRVWVELADLTIHQVFVEMDEVVSEGEGLS